jgi:hypothetical protein
MARLRGKESNRVGRVSPTEPLHPDGPAESVEGQEPPD